MRRNLQFIFKKFIVSGQKYNIWVKKKAKKDTSKLYEGTYSIHNNINYVLFGV